MGLIKLLGFCPPLFKSFRHLAKFESPELPIRVNIKETPLIPATFEMSLKSTSICPLLIAYSPPYKTTYMLNPLSYLWHVLVVAIPILNDNLPKLEEVINEEFVGFVESAHNLAG